MYKVLTLSLLILSLGGCGKNPVTVDHKPFHEPGYNFTQSSDLLSCVGHLIDQTQAPPVDIFISNIPDHTIPSIEAGFLTKNAVMMATTAVDRLETNKVAVVGHNGGLPGRRQLQILGAFTELNRTTQSNALSSEMVLPGGFEFEIGADRNYNHIALDLALSENNRIVPHSATSVGIHIYGSSGNTTLTFDDGNDFAAVGALGFTAQEGFHASSRLLVETSVAVMMSRYYNLNITACLTRVKKEDVPDPRAPYETPVFTKAVSQNAARPDKVARPDKEEKDSIFSSIFSPFSSSTPYAGKGSSALPPPVNTIKTEHFNQAESQPENLTILPKTNGKRWIITEEPPEYQQKPDTAFSVQTPVRAPSVPADKNGFPVWAPPE